MSKTLTIELAVDFDAAYEYLQNPLNLSNWVEFFQKITQSENGLTAETPLGFCELAFVAPNDYGVLDHVVRDSAGREYFYPMRAIRNGDKTFLTVTLLDEDTDEAVKTVEADLARLKKILESR